MGSIEHLRVGGGDIDGSEQWLLSSRGSILLFDEDANRSFTPLSSGKIMTLFL